MAEKPVIWSLRAQKSRLEILKYWVERNGTPTYSESLLEQFMNVTQSIQKNPQQGKPTNYGKIRMRTVRKYAIFYEEMDERIEILLVWDLRRDPTHLDQRLGKHNR